MTSPGNTPIGAKTVTVDLREDMAAFDVLPAPVRRALSQHPRDQSAEAVLQVWHALERRYVDEARRVEVLVGAFRADAAELMAAAP